MWIRAIAATAVLLLGCSGGGGAKYTRKKAPALLEIAQARAALEKEFLQMIEEKNDRALAHMFSTPVGYGGVWFPDTACRRRLSGAGLIPEAGVDELARCVSQLPIKRSERQHPYPDVAVFEYEPGIEIEALFDNADGGHLMWIGFVGRHDVKDALPTVTQASLIALREEVAPFTLDEQTRSAIDEELATYDMMNPPVFAWFKVCVDAAGAVSGVHARRTSSLNLQDALVPWIKQWRFRSFKLGDQPSPVCSMMKLGIDGQTMNDGKMPHPTPPDMTGIVVVEDGRFGKLVAGDIKVPALKPSDGRPAEDMTIDLAAMLMFCIDTTGKVDTAVVMRSSGVKELDDGLRKTLLTRQYTPLVHRGTAVPACTHRLFTYRRKISGGPGIQ